MVMWVMTKVKIISSMGYLTVDFADVYGEIWIFYKLLTCVI